MSELQDLVAAGDAGAQTYTALGNALLEQLRDTGDTALGADAKAAFTAGARP